MACQMIWLFGYISLGLALTLGNRPAGVHINQRPQVRSRYEQQQPQQQQQQRQSPRDVSDLATPGDSGGGGGGQMKLDKIHDLDYRYDIDSGPYDLPPDWIVYDKNNAWNLPDKEHINGERDSNNNGIIDDFTSAVIETLYPRKMKNDMSNKLISDYIVNDRRTRIDNDDDVDDDDDDDDENRKSDTALPINNHYDIMSKRMMRSDRGSRTINWQPHIDGNDDDNWIRMYDRNNDGYIMRSIGKRNYGSASGRRRQTGTGESRSGQSNQQGSSSSTSPGIIVPPSSSSANAAAASVGGMASQFMLRAARGNRQYDVPQIECPSSEEGMERFACPTPDRMGRYRCIDDHVLCDGFIDCPTGEDEDRQACMFYKTTKAHLDVLADALLRWVRGR